MNGIMIVLFFLSPGSLFFLLTLQSYAVFSPPPYFSLFFVSLCCDTRPYLRQIEEYPLKSVANRDNSNCASVILNHRFTRFHGFSNNC